MERECHHRVLLLDLGHPMNISTTKNVINSLENVMALGSAFRRNDKEISVGMSVLNSDFAMFQSQSTLCKNYHLIIKRLETLLKTLKSSNRTTVQEYKYLLSRSIEAVLCEFQKFNKRDTRSLIQIAVITKKTGKSTRKVLHSTVLADILRDVTKKLSEVNPSIHSVEKYKIVQIMSEERENIYEDPHKDSLIDCTSCIDNVHALNCFLKDWLLNPQQQLRILLSKDPEFWMECDMYDCIINPVSSTPEGKFDIFNEFPYTSSKGFTEDQGCVSCQSNYLTAFSTPVTDIFYLTQIKAEDKNYNRQQTDSFIEAKALKTGGNAKMLNECFCLNPFAKSGTSKPSYELEVINRLPVDGLCPTLVFGIPRRLYATTSRALGWTESQNNSKLFRQLCRELSHTRQGLLAKTALPAESSYLTGFHFLTSGGDMLLLNDVSPEELYLPNWEASTQPDFCEDTNAALVIEDCLKKIEYLDEYAMNTFSSGIFEHLRRSLGQVGESKNFLEPLILGFKISEEKSARKDLKTLPSASQCHFGGSSVGGASKARKKKQKTSSEVETENVHPALLTPNVVEKFRKVKSSAFNLPELDINCNDAVK